MSLSCCIVVVMSSLWAPSLVGGGRSSLLVGCGVGCSSGALIAFSGWSCWALITVGGWWWWALSVVGEGVVLGTHRCWCHLWVVCCCGCVIILSCGVVLLSLWHGHHLLWLWLWSVIIVIGRLLSEKMMTNDDVVHCLVAM